MSTLERLKVESQSEQITRKKEQETRRALLILIARYLQQVGYVESFVKLQNESGIQLDKFDVADNIDLGIIVQEFEEYYSFKYGKKPKLVKKLEQTILPKIQEKGVRPAAKKQSTNSSQKSRQNPQAENRKLEIEGKQVQNVQAQPESNEEFFENRLLKPLPDFHNEEFKELAQSIYHEILQQNPSVLFKEIIGLQAQKQILKESILMPFKYPTLFTGLRSPWKGVLLFGPPGTGKTMLAKAVATECRTTFFNISASSIPSTIFIDEIDSILGRRDSSGEHEASRRMKTELLIQLDGLVKEQNSNERIFLLAASNLPWDLDLALLRRLEKRIYVPLPSQQARLAMLQSFLKSYVAQDFPYQNLCQSLENYSGSDIKLVCKEAAMRPIRRLLSKLERESIQTENQADREPPQPDLVNLEDFQQALEGVKPAAGVNEELYNKWVEQHGAM